MKSKRYIDSFRKAARESAQKKANEIIEAQGFNEAQLTHLERRAAEWAELATDDYFSKEALEDEELDSVRSSANKIFFQMEEFIAGIASERDGMVDMKHAEYVAVYFLAKAFYEAEDKEA